MVLVRRKKVLWLHGNSILPPNTTLHVGTCKCTNLRTPWMDVGKIVWVPWIAVLTRNKRFSFYSNSDRFLDCERGRMSWSLCDWLFTANNTH